MFMGFLDAIMPRNTYTITSQKSEKNGDSL